MCVCVCVCVCMCYVCMHVHVHIQTLPRANAECQIAQHAGDFRAIVVGLESVIEREEKKHGLEMFSSCVKLGVASSIHLYRIDSLIVVS